jgi:hypothetical protein
MDVMRRATALAGDAAGGRAARWGGTYGGGAELRRGAGPPGRRGGVRLASSGSALRAPAPLGLPPPSVFIATTTEAGAQAHGGGRLRTAGATTKGANE